MCIFVLFETQRFDINFYVYFLKINSTMILIIIIEETYYNFFKIIYKIYTKIIS